MTRSASGSPARPVPAGSAANVFRTQIEAARAEGVDVGDMTLRLTLGDVQKLKRDATVPVQDIRFADGVMTYLGVRIEPGNVPASTLDVRRQDSA